MIAHIWYTVVKSISVWQQISDIKLIYGDYQISIKD